MIAYALLILFGLQLKHLIADYMLQTTEMISQKSKFFQLGGYAHAGEHILGSVIVLAIAQVPMLTITIIVIAEFIVHYALDYLKDIYSAGVQMADSPRKYWALHGIDQSLHHLTYLVMTYFAVTGFGL